MRPPRHATARLPRAGVTNRKRTTLRLSWTPRPALSVAARQEALAASRARVRGQARDPFLFVPRQAGSVGDEDHFEGVTRVVSECMWIASARTHTSLGSQLSLSVLFCLCMWLCR